MLTTISVCVPVVFVSRGLSPAALWAYLKVSGVSARSPRSHTVFRVGLFVAFLLCSSPYGSGIDFLCPFSTRCTLAGESVRSGQPQPAVCGSEGPAVPLGLMLINLFQRVAGSATWDRACLTPFRSRDHLHRHFPLRHWEQCPFLRVITLWSCNQDYRTLK